MPKKITKEYITCKLKEVIDGDTVILKAYLGIGIFCNVYVRLEEIDAPEIFGVSKDSEEFKRGQIAKLEVKQWFSVHGEDCILVTGERDCHGRWLGDIFNNKYETCLNTFMKTKGYKSTYKRMTRFNKLKDE